MDCDICVTCWGGHCKIKKMVIIKLLPKLLPNEERIDIYIPWIFAKKLDKY